MQSAQDEAAYTASSLVVEGVEVITGTQWRTVTAPLPFLAKVKARASAVRHGNFAGKVVKANRRTFSYTLFDESATGKTCGDMAISNMIRSRNDERDSIVVFIYALKSQGTYQMDRYWLVALQSNGEFLQHYEHICENKSHLQKELASLKAISDYDIAYLDTQQTALESVLGQDALLSSTGDTTWRFSKSDFLEAVKDNDCQIETLHRPVNIQANKMVYATTGVLAVTLTFSAFSYFYLSDSNEYLGANHSYLAARDTEKQLSEIIDSLSERTTWTDKNFVEAVKEEFFENEKSHPYRPRQVAEVIRAVNRKLPTYLAEWQFETIRYDNGKFFARYKRDPRGKGVYFVLDEKIKSLDSLIHEFRVEPAALRDLATVRDYEIIPSTPPQSTTDAQSQLQEMAKRKRAEVALKDLAEDASRIAKSLKRKFQIYQGLTFTDKWILMAPVELAQDAKRLERKLDQLKGKVGDVQANLNAIDNVSIPPSTLLGNKLDFISMMHVDSFFTWSPPVSVATFPNKKALNDRQKKGKKGNASSPYEPAVLIYSVTVETQDKADENKTRSYGVDDMLKLSNYIDKPFVDVSSVEYFRQDEQWEYTIMFYRKMPAYDKFFN